MEPQNVNEFINTWLDLQCRMIAGASKGVLFLGAQNSGSRKAVAFWPEITEVTQSLSDIASDAFSRREAVIHGCVSVDNKSCDLIAFPIQIEGNALGVLAVELTPRNEEQQRAVVQLLQWGTAWLALLMHQQPSARMDRVVRVLDLVAQAVDQKHFHAAATAVTTELAHRLSCDQVSIGFCHGRKIRVQGAAYSAKFGERTNLMQAVASAMEESWQHDATVLFPPSQEVTSNYFPNHTALAAEPGIGSICTVPFSAQGEILGAFTFVRSPGKSFDTETVEYCEHVASLIGPILNTKRCDDRWLGGRILDSSKIQLSRLFGKGHPVLKAGVAAFCAIVALMGFITGEYRVTADARLEGSVQRAIVAPINGYLATAEVRPGDVVQIGQVLATLDEKDLELEYAKWQSEESKLQREHRSAMAERDRSEVSILSAQLQQAKVQLQLVEEQLSRTKLVAPYAGIVVEGDPGQSLGAPVERGDLIYTIAPLNGYRVILQVDERDIGEISVGQQGALTLSSLPNAKLAINVTRITPVASVEDGRNRFRVEADLLDANKHLRPGMEGVAKVSIEERRWLWTWTHRLTNWLRLWAWTWWP
jgi:biotin carboxyl carrier protein